MRRWLRVLGTAVVEYYADGGPRLAASLAYYAAFSLAPLLVIAVGLAGLAFPRDFAADQIIGSVTGLLGPAAGAALSAMVYTAIAEPSSGAVATVVGLATLFFGASAVLGELRSSLNTMWRVKTPPFTWASIARDRLMSFGMVLGIGFLLMVSLIVSTALTALGTWLAGDRTSGITPLALIDTSVSFAVATLLFAAIFKRIPDRHIAWRDVWGGALLTAVLFTTGKSALGWYLGRAATTSAYGAAGSFVALMVWVYYSAQILLYGAEITRVATTAAPSVPIPAQR